jgi:anti-sigma factor ChrR (cupin superfamily)
MAASQALGADWRMQLNADFSKRVVIRPEDYRWVDSPMPGVQRMMLDRIGEEIARATSLVRFAPNTSFSAHMHSGGEEFFVLGGVFADEHRAYPAGTYVRNPVGTQHTPGIGSEGCLILVKLHQFATADRSAAVIDTGTSKWLAGGQSGIEYLPLHRFGSEQVKLIRWAPQTSFLRHRHEGGAEIFVVDGTYYDEYGEYPAGSWVRNPDRSAHAPFTRAEGALLYAKTGHLPPG